MSTDLWPDFNPEKIHSLSHVLRSAGVGLSTKTNGLMEFRVVTTAKGTDFYHDCSIWVPTIRFNYPLVKVTHGIDSYPADLVADPFPNGVTVYDDEDLYKRLEAVFHSPQAIKIVEQLLVIA